MDTPGSNVTVGEPTNPFKEEALDGTDTVSLLCPIEIGGITYDKIKFEQPKAKHMAKFEISGSIVEGEAPSLKMGPVLEVARLICDCPAMVIDELYPKDSIAVFSLVLGFLGAGRGTGESS